MGYEYRNPGRRFVSRPLMTVMSMAAIFVLTACQSPCKPRPEVEESVPAKALKYSLGKLDSPFAPDGRGPREYSCAGMILDSYAQALGSSRFLVDGEGKACGQVPLDVLYGKNVTLIQKEEAQPGDMVFFQDERAEVVQAGLFIKWIDADTMGFIVASPYHGKVVIDTWPVFGIKQNLRVAGFGKLKPMQIGN